ncbi:hypothetical protein ACGH6R_08790 [Gilliamella sp. CG13]|uniref:hypothetical protein n=1 Tax=Gilliamella sp. CG13 TaxID=3351502 RepID=UPI003987BD7C
MKKPLYKLKNYILKYPVLFWVVALTYIVSVIILTMNKREAVTFYFIISYVVLGVGYTIYYKFYTSKEQKKFTKDWLKIVFTLPKKKINKKKQKKHPEKVLHLILFLSGWGAIFGCLAFLTFLFKCYWLISFLLFILQFLSAITIMITYIIKREFNELEKIIGAALLTLIYIVLDFIGENQGRTFVTDMISVYPEQIPTITQGLYWFCFILFASFFLQLIAIFWLDLAKNRKLSYKLPFITYFLVFISIALPSQLIVFNGESIIKTSVAITYKADTINYFKCNNKIIKNVPNDTARYLKIDELEFRTFYFEKDKSDIQMTTYLCNGSDYTKVDIHK